MTEAPVQKTVKYRWRIPITLQRCALRFLSHQSSLRVLFDAINLTDH